MLVILLIIFLQLNSLNEVIKLIFVMEWFVPLMAYHICKYMNSMQVTRLHHHTTSFFHVFCRMFFFEREILQENRKRYETPSSSIKMTNHSITKIKTITLFNKFRWRKINIKMTNILKRNKKS